MCADVSTSHALKYGFYLFPKTQKTNKTIPKKVVKDVTSSSSRSKTKPA